MTRVRRGSRLCSTDGVPAKARIRSVRPSLPWQPSCAGILLRDQFLCMAFAQLSYRESLRDIETCLRAMQPKLYHAGFRSRIARSTLADANERRDWRIYADLAHVLIGMAPEALCQRRLCRGVGRSRLRLRLHTIDLCLSLFPWARFRRRKGAVKLHHAPRPGAATSPALSTFPTGKRTM